MDKKTSTDDIGELHKPDMEKNGEEAQAVTTENVKENQILEAEVVSENRKKKKKRKMMITVAGLIGLLVLVYFGASLFFISHYHFNTVIAGADYSCQNKKAVREQILNPSVNFKVVLKGRENLNADVLTENLKMQYLFDDTLDQIDASQNAFLWFISIFQRETYDLPVFVAYDQDELKRELAQTELFKNSSKNEPVDAHISEYQTDTGEFLIEPEKEGAQLDLAKTIGAVEEAFKTIALSDKEVTIDLDQAGCYKEPKVTAENPALQAMCKEANQLVKSKITYDWNGNIETLDGSIISTWVAFQNGKAALNEDKVEEYIKECARKNDTYGKNRNFITTSGAVISLRSGAYGWKTDKEAETAALIEDIKKGTIRKKEPLYQTKGYVKGQNDIGNSYVEANLSAQHLYIYKNGNIIFETDFVSGNLSNGCGTPAGVFGITYKTRDATLKGDTYETPVKYWMPFNGNIGMHDATWRAQFGGDIYLTRGSHGCINLPLASAEEIYKNVETGFPVICYY